MKAATKVVPFAAVKRKFQSTPPVKAATIRQYGLTEHAAISIHAAREGGDAVNNRNAAYSPISIHAAREGGDEIRFFSNFTSPVFQSTPPVKAATSTKHGLQAAARFQSTPPVKAATRQRLHSVCKCLFQSTPPVKAATVR